MVKFWLKRKNKKLLQFTGAWITVCFLFSTVSAPFVQSSLWEERRKSLQELQKRTAPGSEGTWRRSPLQLASASGGSSFQSVVGNGLMLPSPIGQSTIPNLETHSSEEVLNRVLRRVHSRNSQSKQFSGIPSQLLSKIEPYGEVERVYLAPGIKQGVPLLLQETPLIIQIQDAHGVYSVQSNIARLLWELMGMGVQVVGVEGSEGHMKRMEEWRKDPNKDVLVGIAGYLMKEGHVSGAEIAGLDRDQEDVEFYGVEEKKPYLEQVKSFNDTLNNSKDVEIWKEGIGQKIETLKEKYYSPELKELDQQQKRYEKGDLKLGAWIEILGDAKQPNISKYLQAYQLEKSLNFKQVESDQKKLLETLSRNLKREDLVELLEESLAYRLGRIGYSEFYDGLKERCGKTGMVLTPEMERYIGYVTLVEGIVRDKLFKELKFLEDEAWRIKGTPYLIPSSQHHKDSVDGIKYGVPLIQMDRDYKLLVKALDFKLSPEEWEEYGRREKAIGEMVKGSVAEPLLENVSRFNRLSHQRNQIFVEKLRRRMEEKKTNGSILVAGGYHSQGIEEILKRKNISYLTIRPNLEISEIGENYHPLHGFKRDLLPLEKMFYREKVSMAEVLALGGVPGAGALTRSVISRKIGARQTF
ncbi:MAG: hypothetical protein HY610_02775, partial [Elusimicrobia bacterium]|nr:hypothetical protein [Elusimicrobiota bacterium]